MLAWLRQRSRYFRAISVFTMKVASDLAQPDCCYYPSTLASVFAIFHWRTHISTCRSVNSFLPLTTLYVRHIVKQYVNVFDTEMKKYIRQVTRSRARDLNRELANLKQGPRSVRQSPRAVSAFQMYSVHILVRALACRSFLLCFPRQVNIIQDLARQSFDARQFIQLIQCY